MAAGFAVAAGFAGAAGLAFFFTMTPFRDFLVSFLAVKAADLAGAGAGLAAIGGGFDATTRAATALWGAWLKEGDME